MRPLASPSDRRLLVHGIGRTRNVERRWAIPGRIIYVGTAGEDGVDALLSADSPPFTNGTNADPTNEPVCFWLGADAHVHVSGKFSGVTAGQALFTFPAGYRPFQRAGISIPTATAGVSVNGVVDTDGVLTIVG